MDTEIDYWGCIAISRAMHKVLLVKPDGCNSWSFPMGKSEGEVGRQAAARVVDQQTGINLYDDVGDDFIQVPFPPGSAKWARLYIVHGVPRKTPTPAHGCLIGDAAWKELRDVIELPDSTLADDEAVMPFVKELRQWVSKRHHLRTEPDIDIGLSALFNSTRHKARTLPKPTLSALLRNNGMSEALFHVFEPPEVKYADFTMPTFNGKTFACTCTLPDYKLNITPEFCYFVEDDAEQMAAMAALLFLSGGLDQNSKWFNLAPIGSPPPRVEYCNETVTEYMKRNREGALLNEKMHFWQTPGHNMIPAKSVLQYKAHLKTPVSLVEDFCAKRGYSLKFQFEVRENGFIGLITIPQLGFVQFDGKLKEHKSQAKDSVAHMMLELLKERGMYVP